MVSDLERQLVERDDNVARMRQEHESVLQPLREETGRLQSGNLELQSQLAQQRDEIDKIGAEQRATVAQLSDAIERAGQLETDKLQLSGEKLHLEDQLGDVSAQLAAMEQSTSWKLTRPLRSLGFRVQRFKSWSAASLGAVQAEVYPHLPSHEPAAAACGLDDQARGAAVLPRI